MEFTHKNSHVVLVDEDEDRPQSSILKHPPPADPRLTRALGKWKIATQFTISKPKSRLCESNRPPPVHRLNVGMEDHEPLNNGLLSDSSSSSDYDDDEYEDGDEEGRHDSGEARRDPRRGMPRRRRRKVNKHAVFEWTLFMTFRLLISGWVVAVLVFVIKRNFMLGKKVLYFVYGLRRSVQNCAWLWLVLCTWIIVFPNVHKQNKMMRNVFRALVAVLIGPTIWLIKIVSVNLKLSMVLASSFHVATFFHRMKESIFHHYILDNLSGLPLVEAAIALALYRHAKSLPARLMTNRTELRKFDEEKLRKLSMETRASAWRVKRRVNYVRSSGLTTISTVVDDLGKAEITASGRRGTAPRGSSRMWPSLTPFENDPND